MMDFCRRNASIQLVAQGTTITTVFLRQLTEGLFVEDVIEPEMLLQAGILPALISETSSAAAAGVRLEAMFMASFSGLIRTTAGAGFPFF